MRYAYYIAIFICSIGLTGQTVRMGPMTPPLEPEKSSVLSQWDDTALWAYENGLIEGVWAAAARLFDAGQVAEAYQALSALDAYWWQISHSGGIRGAMGFIRAMYAKAPQKFKQMPLYRLVLAEAHQVEEMTR